MVAVSGDVMVARPRRRVRARFSLRVKVVYGARGGSKRDSVVVGTVAVSWDDPILSAGGGVCPAVGGGLGCFAMNNCVRHECG